MEKIRSFIAIELPPEVKLALARIQEKLKAAGSAPVRWVDAANIHLTLKFLGDIDTEITGRITSALEEAARGIKPFDIEVSGLGMFPNLKRVQVVWVGLTGEMEKLGQLQKRIEDNLIPLGFPAEARAFTPHLTIARVRDYAGPEERQCLGQLIEKAGFNTQYTIIVDSVQLMRSQLTREGPVYSRISMVKLK
jgi:2'-5' RNA ligase